MTFNYFVLALPFTADGDVLLIESGRFPYKYNGIGGIIDMLSYDVNTRQEVDNYMKEELGVITDDLQKKLAIIFHGHDFMVFVYRIDLPDEPTIIPAANLDRKFIRIPPEHALTNKDILAPHLSTLISMACEDITSTPFTFHDPR